MRGVWRIVRSTLIVLAIGAVLLLATAWLTLRASLPHYQGELTLAGTSADVRIERDALGVASIMASNRSDALRALGFVHAQERYFEMDLMRRAAAGELAALFGAAALPLDRRHRLHRFRARAAAVHAAASSSERADLAAYVEGVNAGLEALSARPFPYLLLGQAPRPWQAEDSLLVGFAMFFDLHDEENTIELARARLRAALPRAYVDFVDARGSEWDAPLDGSVLPVAPIPGPEFVDLRRLDPALFGRDSTVGGDFGIGSNNWAVAGTLTSNGAAIVANDMHLGLRVPNIWFRARLRYPAADGSAIDLNGAFLPGAPALIAGSNGHVAWGFTNTYGDWLDWAIVPWSDSTRTRYRYAAGELAPSEQRERIEVAGGEAQALTVRETVWGPIAHEDASGSFALVWSAYQDGASNLVLGELAEARDVQAALAIAQRAGMPPQNFVVGDREGRIAWTIAGRIPVRSGIDREVPSDFSQPGAGWQGWLAPEQHPRALDPDSGRLWSANTRAIGGAALEQIGDGGYALGARAAQIRDALHASARLEPSDMLAIQLDDRALFLERWRTLMAAVAGASPGDAAMAALARAIGNGPMRATTDAVDYRLVRAFRRYVHEIVLDGLAAPMRVHEPEFVLPALHQAEGVVWRLIEARPLHLLPHPHASWDALLASAARRVFDELDAQPGGLAARRWGERNTSAIRHPLSRALPVLAWLLDMPARALPGDTAMPRVQGPSFGASQRFAVAPGHEDKGYFHMPGGQSGHPLSPYYGAGHEDWELGTPTPFLPGAAQQTLLLHAASAPTSR
jgi:penicillin amidase